MNLRSYGLSLLALSMSIGTLARLLHVSDAVSIGMSIASGLMSVTAIALFVQAAPPNRKPQIVTVCFAALVAAATFVVVIAVR